MTNYNERLDEILVDNFEEIRVIGCTVESIDRRIAEAKQAITSLIKELVEEAQPGTWVDLEDTDDLKWQGYVDGVIDFERNLLRALEQL